MTLAPTPRWLGAMTGRDCRLPSEAEWEYAARAGTRTEYALPAPDGSDDINGKGLANSADCGSEWDSKQTAPVGSFPANAWGLRDMHGNVWEWVEDCWQGSYDGASENGQPWLEDDDCNSRVLRGGSWLYSRARARSAGRDWYYPDDRSNFVGFRVVCSSPILGHWILKRRASGAKTARSAVRILSAHRPGGGPAGSVRSALPA